MNYKLLGKTGLRVSEMCLGTMTFGEEWGFGADRAESLKVFEAYADAGGNFIDTANRYTEGTSESMVGEFVKPDRDHFVIASKYTLYDKLGDPNYAGNHRKNMMRSVEGSLKRMNIEAMDILYLHAWDFLTPIEEVLRGVDDLVSSGKIHYAGISDTPAWIVSAANAQADLRGKTRFNALQLEYSLIQRTPERDLLPMAKAMDIAVTAWAPLAGGALTGKYLKGNKENQRLAEDSARLSENNRQVTQTVVDIAAEIDCTPAQLAIAWTMANHPQVIPIVGARNAKQMKDSVKAVELQIPEDQLTRLNEVSSIDLGFPHEFLKQERVGELVFGIDPHQIANHRG